MCSTSYLWIDVVIVIAMTWATTTTRPLDNLDPPRPTSSLLGPVTLGSVLGMQAIHLIFMLIGLATVKGDENYMRWPVEFSEGASWWLQVHALTSAGRFLEPLPFSKRARRFCLRCAQAVGQLRGHCPLRHVRDSILWLGLDLLVRRQVPPKLRWRALHRMQGPNLGTRGHAGRSLPLRFNHADSLCAVCAAPPVRTQKARTPRTSGAL